MPVPPPLQKALSNSPLQPKPSQAKPTRLTVEKEKFFVKKKMRRKIKNRLKTPVKKEGKKENATYCSTLPSSPGERV